MKKLLAAIAAAWSLSLSAAVPYNGQTEPGEYTISTYAQLTNFTQAVRGTYQTPGFPFTNSTITLAADIDCNGGIIAGHERHGNYYDPSSFSGVFDGAGHTIRNYSVNVKKANAYETGQVSYGLAMFDVVKDGAVIRNLKLDTAIVDRADPTGSYPDDGYYPFDAPCAAAFAMYAEGANAVTFENCTFKGMVSYHGSAAAFVGKATRNPADAPDSTVVTLTGCGLAEYVNIHARTNSVTSVKSIAGGLVAEGEGIVATDCTAGTSLEDQIWIDGASLAGGIVGRAADSTFTRCTSAANVAYQSEISPVSGDGCGGIVGHASNSTFRSCASCASVTWSSPVIADGWWRRTAARSFSAIGGMAGLTDGASEFYDCTVSNTLSCVYGLGGGFVGWTAGAETFSNCTAVVTVKDEVHPQYVVGGFAASVASSGARFIDCTVRASGDKLKSGFLDVQDAYAAAGPVGTNYFTRCVVTNSTPSAAGFAGGVTNAVFDGCLVVDSSSGGAGFAGAVACGTFTNCTVSGVSSDVAGFVRGATNAVFACCQVTNSTSGGVGFSAKSARSSFALCTVVGSSAGTAGFDGDSAQSTFTGCQVAGSSVVGAGFTGESASSVFDGCAVTNVTQAAAGFAQEASGGTFTNCTVYGATGRDGFIAKAWAQNVFRSCSVVGAKVANGFVWDAYTGNLFEGCAVLESKVTDGFVNGAGRDDGVFGQNVFRDCRVSGVFMNESGGEGHGFAGTLRNGSMVTNCIAYGVARYEMDAFYGFAGTVSSNAVVSGCVGAVAPSKFTAKGAGFADAIQSGAKVEDCYAVFAPRVDARNYSGTATEGGLQGGFARSVGTADPPVARCFTLDSIPPGSVEVGGCGAFCGVIAGGAPRFIGCYRPSESTANDSYGMNYDGIGRRSAAEFASATAETFPDYDFENVWRVPAGAASSPYLAAATDADGNFWTYTAVASGLGRVTVNGGEPLDAYPPGTVLTVRAEAVGESQFTGWIGEGFADPMAPETTYTVRNAGAILATFDMGPYDGQKEPGTYLISTVDQLRQFTATARSYSYGGSTLVLADDIDCGGLNLVAGNLNTPSAFFGTFDGAGHRIFNFSNTVAANAAYGAALFDELGPGARVKDLALEGVVVVESPSLANAAVFAGSARSDYLNGCATIENCSFTGSISNRLGAAVFLGSAFRSPYTQEGVPSVILTNCTANASVFTATNAPAGGLAANAIDILAADCSFAGRVESVGTAGGIAGYAQNSTFTNCSFSGEMAGGTTNTAYRLDSVGCGGLVGFASNSVFRACSAEAAIDWDYSTGAYDRNESENNFIAVGGAAGLTMGAATFDGCSFNGTVQSVHGYAGGFVGWTAGAELFTNCTASASVNPTGSVNNVALGGFAASVGSRGALFAECSVEGASGVISGFYDVHGKCFAAGDIGTNYFTRCTVAGTSASDAGFAGSPAKAVFTGCEVQGGAAFSGFVKMSDGDCTYTDCVVTGATVRVGFVHDTRGTNMLTNCRAGCLYGAHSGELAVSDARYWGFATYLNNYSVLDRCVAYGAVAADRFDVSTGDTYALFARRIDYGATVRRSVGAVTQTFSPRADARFAMALSDDATVENSYSVFQDDAGTALAKDPSGKFWTLAAVVAGEGAILVDGAAPSAAYAPDSVHTIRAVPAQGYVFSHWVGRGYGNVDFAETTYTAGNCGAIAAVFAKEVDTPAEFLAIAENPAASYKVAKDMSLAGFLGEGGASSGILGEFRGRLYGGGHTVSGVRFTDADGGIYIVKTHAALFKSVAPGAQVRDLTVEASAGNHDAVVAGLALAIEDHTLVSNCHVRADFHALPGENWSKKCEYYGIASNVVGLSVRVIDCGVSGTIEAREHAAGLFGNVSLLSGEIARCASFCDIHANGPGGVASGFANSLTVGCGYGGGATVREIVTAGSIFGTATGAGIAANIAFVYNDATVRDMYSTAEVRAYTGYGIASGIAQTISAAQSDNAAISNVWFGGTALGGWRQNYAFADIVENVALENCAYVEWPAAGGKSYVGCGAGPAVAAIPHASRLQRASWPGFDFGGVWTMTENSTTPYFAWSLSNGNFRIFDAYARGATITCADSAAPGASVAVTAGIEPGSDAFFVHWDGAPGYAGRETASTTFLADNHRTANCVWGRNISTPAQLQAVTNDLSGIYHVVADLDMTGFNLSTLGGVCFERRDTLHYHDYNGYYPFFGIFEGNGHTISNMVPTGTDYDWDSYGGLFSRLREAKVGNIRLVAPRVSATFSGALAGEVVLSSVSNCAAIGVCVYGGPAGGLVGRVDGSEISRSFAAGYVSGAQVGGFVGSVTNSVITECFSSGFAKSSQGKGGGFAEEVKAETYIRDCYTVSDVEGGAGFAERVEGDDAIILRCYCAGITRGETSLGGFILSTSGSPTIRDCFRRHYDIYEKTNVRDVGSADHPGIAALLADEMRSVTNFTAYLTARTSSSLPVWEQVDGETHPYFPWSLEDGKLSIVRMTVGRNDWSLDRAALSGVDLVYPGAISGLPREGVNYLEKWSVLGKLIREGRTFFEWNGVPDDVGKRFRAETMTKADNFRTAVARYGLLLENLYALTNNPSGTFGLDGTIDIPEGWEPMGKSSKSPVFAGTIYGGGGGFATANGQPVFHKLGNAVFKGVKFGDTLYGNTVGGAANYAVGNVMFEDCEATAFVSTEVTRPNPRTGEDETVSVNTSIAGAFFGEVTTGSVTFEQCRVSGTIDLGNNSLAGGFIGLVRAGSGTFIDCTSDVDISGNSSLGGMIGEIYGNAGTFSFLRCVANRNINGTSMKIGGFIGSSNGRIVCEDSRANGTITGGYTSSIGGFVGSLENSAATSSFRNCQALGDVSNSYYDGAAGGFVGYVNAANTTFAGCVASGIIRTANEAGGFAGRVYGADSLFTNCVASGVVTGRGGLGGFVARSQGNRSRFTGCESRGYVSVETRYRGFRSGGFVGYSGSSSAAITYEGCRALGGVSASADDYVGGFVGYVEGADTYRRCLSAGLVKGDKYVGGFGGRFYCTGVKVSECFALGDVVCHEGLVGGFAGYIERAAAISDSYATGNVTGWGDYVGGFAGYIDSASSLNRCYMAGVVKGYAYQTGSFAGRLGSSVSVTNCAVLAGGVSSYPIGIVPAHAIGNSYSNTTEHANIAELGGTSFRSSANFAAFHEAVAEDGETHIWSQVDGKTQPYLTWSAPDGNLSVYPVVYGADNGTISVDRERAPAGSNVMVTAYPKNGSFFFASWTGSAPYADATNAHTTLTLDNHRAATTQFGRYIYDADELQAVEDDLDGVFGLACDIDLSNLHVETEDGPQTTTWKPIGYPGNGYNFAFTGKFLGFGHTIDNLVCTNGYGGGTGYVGLFGDVSFATLDGIEVSGRVYGSQEVGGLAGRAKGCLVTNCVARVEVNPLGSSRNGPFGGLVGEISGTTVIGCRADGFVKGGGRVGGLVGTAGEFSAIFDSAARGDVCGVGTASGEYYGTFAGLISTSVGSSWSDYPVKSVVVSNCWCSGEVWGSSSAVGSFVGYGGHTTTVIDCAVADGRTAKRRPGGTSGNNGFGDFACRILTAEDLAGLTNGWRAVPERDFSKAVHISTAEELAAITNDLYGIYILDNDIDLKGVAWTPIGDNNNPFYGEFYGNGHIIRNLSVDGFFSSSVVRGGFFGCIGGRVNGLRVKGSVTVKSESSSDRSAGGFAGSIHSGAFVDDCSFRGDVTCWGDCAGGFAGRIVDSAVVAGCCVTGAVRKVIVDNTNRGCGGFAGYMSPSSGGGVRIMDCYSLASVNSSPGESSGSGHSYAGGFVGRMEGTYTSNGKIETSYCSGSVTNAASYGGAFVGSIDRAVITNSYYDCDATPQLAKGAYNTGRSEASPGITPLTHEAMLHAESFTNFDFVATWKIEEGETTPYLIEIGLSKSGYEKWLEENGVEGDPEPDVIGNGIPYGFRYAFNIPMNKGPGDFNPPLFRITFGADGKPRIHLPEQVNEEGVTVEVLASTDLSDFAKEDVADWAGFVRMQYDPGEDAWRPADSFTDPEYVYPDSMFFRWRLVVER